MSKKGYCVYMFGNLGFNADMLAQNKVLDFDAAAYLMDTAPRYIGNPTGPTAPFVMPNQSNPIPDAKLPQQPQIDEFQKQSEDKLNMPKVASWKKWAFGALAIGTAIFAATKFKSAYKWITSKFTSHKTP